MKPLAIIALLTLIVLISGCTQPAIDDTNGDTTSDPLTGQLTANEIESQGSDLIESEMEEAVNDLDLDDIENEIPA